MPPKIECPIYIRLHPDGSSPVKGSPGVPNSIPRIQTTIEIRPVKGFVFHCRSVGVELCTEQRIQLPSALPSSETAKQFRHFSDPQVFAPPMGQFSQELLAVDIPVMIPLDRSVVASSHVDHWGATTVHYLHVRATLGTSVADEQNYIQVFPIPVKLYDTLPLYRQFTEPVCEAQVSSDNQVLVEVQLPVSAVGPQDAFCVNVTVRANPLHNRRKKNLEFRSVAVQLSEILECHDGGLPARKEAKLLAQASHHEGTLTTAGVEQSFAFTFPYENDFLQLYAAPRGYSDSQVCHATASFNKNKNHAKLADGVPLTHAQGFTFAGRLFSLRYEVAGKVKIAHGKDVEFAVPLTVSPFNAASCPYLMHWIKAECQAARDVFGKAAVAEMASSYRTDHVYMEMRRHRAPPDLYLNNIKDWARLGYKPEAFGSRYSDKELFAYID